MWIDDLEAISFDFEQDGFLIRKQVTKKIINKGAWPIIIFLYREWEPDKNDYGEKRVSIYKYRKFHDSFKIEGKINLPSLDVAIEIAQVISKWKEEY